MAMIPQFKIVMLGEGRVGKTSLTLRYVTNNFEEEQKSTLKASYLNKTIAVQEQEGDFHIWDTAGQERYHALNNIYYKGSCGALIVYDVNDRSTFQKVVSWVKELHLIIGPSVSIVIVGNKIDLNRAEISVEEADSYAQTVGASHVLSSAKTGEGVKEAFVELAKRVLKKHSQNSQSQILVQKRRGIVLESPSATKHQSKGRCCKQN